MSRENAETIGAYERAGDKYVERYDRDMRTNRGREWRRQYEDSLVASLDGLPKTAKIFEIGAGDGRDAELIKRLGYDDVTASDAAERFVRLLSSKGLAARKFDVVSDEFDGAYDYVLAQAVLVHLRKDEVRLAIEKVYEALNDGGYFMFSLKVKEDCEEEWTDMDDGVGEKRYFSFWSVDEVLELLGSVGFEILKQRITDGRALRWIEIVAKKKKGME